MFKKIKAFLVARKLKRLKRRREENFQIQKILDDIKEKSISDLKEIDYSDIVLNGGRIKFGDILIMYLPNTSENNHFHHTQPYSVWVDDKELLGSQGIKRKLYWFLKNKFDELNEINKSE